MDGSTDQDVSLSQFITKYLYINTIYLFIHIFFIYLFIYIIFILCYIFEGVKSSMTG